MEPYGWDGGDLRCSYGRDLGGSVQQFLSQL